MSKKKVNFQLAAEIVGDATSVVLLGDFNNWDTESGSTLKRQKDGSFKASLELESGKAYQYRYLLNDGRWVNDGTADEYVFDALYQVENCVVNVPEVKVRAVAKKSVEASKVKKTKTIPSKGK
jgi:1,4-alpha-glucan branching enzyme